MFIHCPGLLWYRDDNKPLFSSFLHPQSGYFGASLLMHYQLPPQGRTGGLFLDENVGCHADTTLEPAERGLVLVAVNLTK